VRAPDSQAAAGLASRSAYGAAIAISTATRVSPTSTIVQNSFVLIGW
jgi:hypothetical protein